MMHMNATSTGVDDKTFLPTAEGSNGGNNAPKKDSNLQTKKGFVIHVNITVVVYNENSSWCL